MSSLVAGLERWLAYDWSEPVRVCDVRESTAGARRQNLLMNVEHGRRMDRLVATVVPPELQSPLDVGREVAVRRLARDNGVPVPAVRSVCTDASYVGAPFFVSDRIDGETVPRRVHRLAADGGIEDRIVEELGVALNALHTVGVDDAAKALGSGPVDQPLRSALRACRNRIAELAAPEPTLSFVLRYLQDRLPHEPDRVALLHADARVGNLVVDPSGLRALLDWEGARLGDPMEDLAWSCTRMWRFGNDARTVGGLSTVDRLRRSYEESGGTWDQHRFAWWRVCGGLQWALELGAQAAGYLDGTTPSIVMAASGRRVSEVAYDLLLLTAAGIER
jgi:aminoglycoside phosphotransferase (APT) family kinase protein